MILRLLSRFLSLLGMQPGALGVLLGLLVLAGVVLLRRLPVGRRRVGVFLGGVPMSVALWRSRHITLQS